MKVIKQTSTGRYVYREATPGDFYLANAADFTGIDVADLEIEDQPAWTNDDWTEASSTYADKRQREYPSIQDQLDMIYQDKVDKTTKWVDEITRIKNKHAKPV